MNKRILVISSLLLALGFLGANAHAMDVHATFNELDKDSNGTLSEAEAGEDAVLHENFSQIDTNQDGQLSLGAVDLCSTYINQPTLVATS